MNTQIAFAASIFAAIVSFACVDAAGAQELSGDEFACETVQECMSAAERIAKDIAEEVDNTATDGSEPLSF